ncbi:MAG TPA: hypothetical protein VIM79_13325 [Niastella sp.]
MLRADSSLLATVLSFPFTTLSLLPTAPGVEATALSAPATNEPLNKVFLSKMIMIVPLKGISLIGKTTIVPLEKFSASKKAMTVPWNAASLTGMVIMVSQKGFSL